MVVNASTDEVEQVNHYYAYGPRSNKEGLIILREKTNPLGEGGIIGNLSSNEGLQEFKFGDRSSQQTGKIEYLPREDEGLSESPDRTYGLDLYDFEARQYDAIAPWFTSIDPLAEKFTWLTPYNYCSGNPVMFADPDGIDNYRYDKKSGNFYLMEKTDDKTDQVFRYNYHKKTNSYK